MAFSPSLHALTAKAMGFSQATPTDARSYFFDTTNFVYRPYVSTAEVHTYLNLPKYRFGNFYIYVNSTGTLNPDGTITGGEVDIYMYKDGTADGDLVVVTSGGAGGATEFGDLTDAATVDLPTVNTPLALSLSLIPNVYNIEEFGAIGDGQTIRDAVTNGTTTITSATANFVTGDVGKSILVNEQLLTITARTNATTIVVSSAVTLTDTDVVIRYGTDNTAAIQAAINAAHAAKGGKIWVPKADFPFFIAGPLITSDNLGNNPNAQLYIPGIELPYQGGNEQPMSIQFEAEIQPNQVEQGFSSSIDVGADHYNQGTIIQSILPFSAVSGTLPSVFGTSGNVAIYGPINLAEMSFKNLWVKVHCHPTNGPYLTAFNGSRSTNTTFDFCRADADLWAWNSAEPSTFCAGFIGVQSNGGTKNLMRDSIAVGFTAGFSIGEHADVQGCQAMGCTYAIDFQKAGHSSTIGHFTDAWCRHAVGFNRWDNGYGTSFHITNMYGFVIERAASQWYAAGEDIKDPANGIRGNMFFTVSTSGSGLGSTVTKDGGTNLFAHYMADEIGSGSSSSSGVGPEVVAFDEAIPFDRYFSIMRQRVGAVYNFTADLTDAITGGETRVILIADGTNAPTFDSSFTATSDSEAYDNTVDQINNITFVFNGNEIEYTIHQGAVSTASTLGTFDIDYSLTDDITESPAGTWTNVNGATPQSQNNAAVDPVHFANFADEVLMYSTLDSAINQGVFMGLDDSNALDYSFTPGGLVNWKFVVTASNNLIIADDEGGSASSPITVTLPYGATSLYGIRITGTVTKVIEAVYSTNGGSTWSVAHTYAGTYSGNLYPKVGCTLASAVCLDPTIEIT